MSEKMQNLFKWVEWVVVDNRVFRFANQRSCLMLNQRNLMVEDVEKKSFFWHNYRWLDTYSSHDLAIFAAYPDRNGNPERPLLAISPLLDERDLTAKSHFHFISVTLQTFRKFEGNMSFSVADNENMN